MDTPKYQPDTSLFRHPEPDPVKREPRKGMKYDAPTANQIVYFLDVRGFTIESVAQGYFTTVANINKWANRYRKEKEQAEQE